MVNVSEFTQRLVVNSRVYSDIAEAIVERDLEKARGLMAELCELKGPQHVAGALTLGGSITSRVRRAAKRLARSRDEQKRDEALGIIGTLVEVDLYAPAAVVDLRPKVGYARL